jgi:hypothetical protein
MATEVNVIPKGFWQQQFESREKKKTVQSKWSWVRCFKGSIEQEHMSSAETVQMLILPLQTHTQGIILLYPTTMRLTSLLMWFLHFLLCVSVKLVLVIKTSSNMVKDFFAPWTDFMHLNTLCCVQLFYCPEFPISCLN